MEWNKLDWDKYDKNVLMIYYYQIDQHLKLSLINILLNRDTDDFFSMTTYGNETTIFVDEDTAEKYGINDKIYSFNLEKYACYQLINTGSFVEESGLVNMISSKLKEEEIPILYITTSNSNFLLVPEEHVERTDKLLNIYKPEIDY